MNKDLTFTSLGEIDIANNKAHAPTRKLPLNENAINILKQIRGMSLSDEYVFSLRRNTYSDKIIMAVAYAKGIYAFDKDGKRNPELKNTHPHSLRSAAGTSLYLKTGDIKIVQWFMFHSTPNMTNRYIKGLDEFNVVKEALKH